MTDSAPVGLSLRAMHMVHTSAGLFISISVKKKIVHDAKAIDMPFLIVL